MYKKGNSELLNDIDYRDQSARVNRKAQSSTRVRDGTNPVAARHVSRDRRPSISPASRPPRTRDQNVTILYFARTVGETTTY